MHQGLTRVEKIAKAVRKNKRVKLIQFMLETENPAPLNYEKSVLKIKEDLAKGAIRKTSYRKFLSGLAQIRGKYNADLTKLPLSEFYDKIKNKPSGGATSIASAVAVMLKYFYHGRVPNQILSTGPRPTSAKKSSNAISHGFIDLAEAQDLVDNNFAKGRFSEFKAGILEQLRILPEGKAYAYSLENIKPEDLTGDEKKDKAIFDKEFHAFVSAATNVVIDHSKKSGTLFTVRFIRAKKLLVIMPRLAANRNGGKHA